MRYKKFSGDFLILFVEIENLDVRVELREWELEEVWVRVI